MMPSRAPRKFLLTQSGSWCNYKHILIRNIDTNISDTERPATGVLLFYLIFKPTANYYGTWCCSNRIRKRQCASGICLMFSRISFYWSPKSMPRISHFTQSCIIGNFECLSCHYSGLYMCTEHWSANFLQRKCNTRHTEAALVFTDDVWAEVVERCG